MSKRDYHQKSRLYHLDLKLNKCEAEKKEIVDKYNEFRGATEKFITEYEYFTQELLPGAILGRTHYDNHCGFFRSYWNIQINYDSDTEKGKYIAKEPLNKRQDTMEKIQTLSHFELCS